MVFSALLSALSLFSLVLALPFSSPALPGYWAPTVTYPTTDTVWVIAGTYTVTWDTSNPPPDIANPYGEIYLRQGGVTGDSPIAQGFSLSDGQATVTVPWGTQPGPDWCVVLVGDFGNYSPEFRIDEPA